MSSRMLRFFKSWASGRNWRCFSRELRRSIGEMGLSSTLRSGVVSSFNVFDMVCWLVREEM